MKYEVTSSRLTKAERELTNSLIISRIFQGEAMPATEVLNSYTGIGGLHGLKMEDFESFHAYTEAKKEFELGQFFTPPLLCEEIIQSLRPTAKMKIADFTCGSGNFFNSLPNESNIYGCELEANAFEVAKFLYPNANIVQGDFVSVRFGVRFDMVVGNPPFNIKTSDGISQLAYMKVAENYLKPGHILCLIVPKSFLEEDYSNKNNRQYIDLRYNFLCQAVIPSHWFDVGIDIKVMYFQKVGNKRKSGYTNDYVPFVPEDIYRDFIKPVEQEVLADRLFLYKLSKQRQADILNMTRIGKTELTMAQFEHIKKLMYELKTHTKLKHEHLEKARNKLKQLEEQERPDNMDYIAWKKIEITPEQVINQLRKWVRSQSKPEPKKVCKLVKKRFSIKYKAYSKALKDQEKELNINDIILKDKPYKGKFSGLLDRKKRAYKLQNTPMRKLERVPALDEFLRAFELHETGKGGGLGLFDEAPVIRLNDKQFEDLGLALQKPYSILSWEMGSGKSIAGMALVQYVRKQVHTVFICAPSLAVKLTWEVRLKKYGFDFILVDHYTDFAKIRRGKIVLISFDMVRVLQNNNDIRRRHVKNFIKKVCAYKIAVLFDESDELSNHDSSRTRAARDCFRKAKYKMLTTGTTTRNNINELYPQLEILYNNSINMICWSTHLHRPDKDGELQSQKNDIYGKPFPAGRGDNYFKYCHCPQKTTVFGIKKDTQDVYNASELKEIIDKTIITRTFDDVVGGRIYDIKSHHVVQGPEEHRLYVKILEEFRMIVHKYYTTTGNERKDAMLMLGRQLKLLIRATSTPHCLSDYEGLEKPMKFYHILDLIKKWDEKVAIGTVSLEAVAEYSKFLQFHVPERPFFIIVGEISFNQRKKIIAQFQATTNGILLSTQQSLKSSVDIETCNKCILEAMQWNLPKMRQYYFRFIRYNSKERKEIHFVTYADSIEQNLLALLMSKEKLNDFVKDPNYLKTRDEVMSEFDLTAGILDQLITKEYDEEGKLYLTWGKGSINR